MRGLECILRQRRPCGSKGTDHRTAGYVICGRRLGEEAIGGSVLSCA